MFSKLFSLNQRQWIKGFALTIEGAVVTALYSTLSSGVIPMTLAALKPIALVGLTTGASYLLHSFGTNSDGKLLTPETIAVK